MNTCPKCGGFINPGEAFCKICGTKIENAPKNTNETIQENNTVNVTNNNNSDGNAKFNMNAICSFSCSVISIFIFWWLSIVGVGTGIKALSEIKNTKEKGKVLAIIGTVLGAIGVTLFFYSKIIN